MIKTQDKARQLAAYLISYDVQYTVTPHKARDAQQVGWNFNLATHPNIVHLGEWCAANGISISYRAGTGWQFSD
jgi:hypothetical protein